MTGFFLILLAAVPAWGKSTCEVMESRLADRVNKLAAEMKVKPSEVMSLLVLEPDPEDPESRRLVDRLKTLSAESKPEWPRLIEEFIRVTQHSGIHEGAAFRDAPRAFQRLKAKRRLDIYDQNEPLSRRTPLPHESFLTLTVPTNFDHRESLTSPGRMEHNSRLARCQTSFQPPLEKASPVPTTWEKVHEKELPFEGRDCADFYREILIEREKEFRTRQLRLCADLVAGDRARIESDPKRCAEAAREVGAPYFRGRWETTFKSASAPGHTLTLVCASVAPEGAALTLQLQGLRPVQAAKAASGSSAKPLPAAGHR